MIPRFGTVPPGTPARRRPGAYGLALVGGSLLVVTAPDGQFLPGGGLDPGEAPEDGLRREFREETGYRVTAAEPLGRAEQVIPSGSPGVFVVKDCRFYVVDVEHRGDPEEEDHHPRWLPVDDAIGWLAEPASAWAVRLVSR